MTRDLETSKFKINMKGLFWEAVLHSMARLGVSKVNPKFKVATAVVDAATRVMDRGFTSLLGVLNVFGIRRRDLDLEASKFKVLMTEVVTVRRGLEASKFKVLVKVSTTVKGLINDARLGAPNVAPKFKVSTVVVEPATRVLGDAVFNRKTVYLEASKFNDPTLGFNVLADVGFDGDTLWFNRQAFATV